MGSPIIACLGAATLLILASCSFGPITATESPDYSIDRHFNGASDSRRAFRPERSKSKSLEGYVRISNFSSGLPIPHAPHQRQTGIGSRSSRGGGNLSSTSNGVSKDPTKDYFTMLGEQVLTIIEIAAKEIDKGITNVRGNINRHRDGGMKALARTIAGRNAGRSAEKYLKHFLKEPWDSIVANIIQEAVDRFYIGADIYVNKKASRKERTL